MSYLAEEVAQARAAWNMAPQDLNVVIPYATMLAYADYRDPKGIEEALAIMNRAKPHPDAPQGLAFYYHYLMMRETAERMRKGLMPQHVGDRSELFFPHCQTELAEQAALLDRLLAHDKTNLYFLSGKSISLLAQGHRRQAEPYFQALRASEPVNGTVIFADSYFRGLEEWDDEALLSQLPPMYTLVPQRFDAANVMYLSCNIDYFVHFARTMLLSIATQAPGSAVHVHVMDGTDNNWAAVRAFCEPLDLQIAVSVERPEVIKAGYAKARLYYHAVRFIRFYQHLGMYNTALWMMDVDGLMNSAPARMFARLGAGDVALRAAPGIWEPWSLYYGSLVGIRPTGPGVLYARLVAAFIADAYRRDRLQWGIDQLALFSVAEFLHDAGRGPALHFVNERESDSQLFDDGVVWCNAGKGKFGDAKRLAKGTTTGDARRDRYVSLLRRYADML